MRRSRYLEYIRTRVAGKVRIGKTGMKLSNWVETGFEKTT